MKIICQDCGTGIEATEYHPMAFCILYNAGLDPYEVIREAAPHVLTDAQIAPDLLASMNTLVRGVGMLRSLLYQAMCFVCSWCIVKKGEGWKKT